MKTWTPAVSSVQSKAMRDRDMEAAIAEEIKEDDRIDAEELLISCNEGVVTLGGVLPSEQNRQTLLALIEDVFDVEDVVDQIRIDRQPWERADRSPDGETTDSKTDEEIMLDGEDVETDVMTAMQEGVPVMPPSEFIPEREQP